MNMLMNASREHSGLIMNLNGRYIRSYSSSRPCRFNVGTETDILYTQVRYTTPEYPATSH